MLIQALQEAMLHSLGVSRADAPAMLEPAQPARGAQAHAQEVPEASCVLRTLPEVSVMMTLIDCKVGVMLQNGASIR